MQSRYVHSRIRESRLFPERLEDRRLLAANLSISDAFLRNGMGQRITAPVIGERVAVQVNYETTDLPNDAQFRIDFKVDGVTLSSDTVTRGAGQSSASGFWYRSGWYAEPGEHFVEVMLDAGLAVDEENESDNARSFVFSPTMGQPPNRFIWPVEGIPFVDHTISNYVDVDPRSDSVRDFQGGDVSYDGHDALDISTGNFSSMDAGIRIFAAADGVVVATHDGEFDRNTGWTDPAPMSNYVTIDHGQGWRTQYIHLRRDSISVSVGDQLRAGDVIGLMGSSGRSTITHLHFEVQHNGYPVETMFTPESYWLDAPRYVLNETTMLFGGITNHYPESHRLERPSDVVVYSQAADQVFRSWTMVSGLEQTDTVKYVSYRPDGSIFRTGSANPKRDFGRSRWSFERTLPTVPDLGRWRVDFSVDSQLIGSEFFDVTSNGAPEMRIDDENGDLVLDERYTPISFGSSNQGDPPQSRRFTVTNHGSDTLILGRIRIPDGYVLSEDLVRNLAPGKSDTFRVDLSTATPGYFAGEISVESNDMSELIYNFSVEGIVTSAALDTLTLGISQRSAGAGDRLVANVRRHGSTGRSLTVDLDSLSAGVSLPSTVKIPSGEERAIFFIEIDGDSPPNGEGIANVRARASGHGTAINALRIRTRLPGDANGDNEVTFADFLALSANFGKANVDWEGGDFTGDGQVKFEDFLILSGNFGQRR